MAQTSYIEELENELKQTDPNSHANRLVTQEIDRLVKGEDDNNKERKERPSLQVFEIHNDRPQRCTIKVRIPIKEFPKYNFVGKLLGPRGATLKALQDQTGCKMAVMGKGSMREKDKEDELRKQGGKYAHLNEELHVQVDCYAQTIDAHHRMAAALVELRKFLIPQEMGDEMYGGGDNRQGGDMSTNGAPRGRGGFRGGAPERGRGGFRGRGNGHAPPPAAGRGAPAGRGGPPMGGPPRGGPAAPRGGPVSRGGRGGAPPARGGRAPAPPASYDAYNQQSYSGGAYSTGYDNSGYDEYGYSGASHGSGYDQSYDESYRQDPSYYDYSQSGNAVGSYESYPAEGGYGEYAEGWSAGPAGGAGGKTPSAPTRGAARGMSRSHPYPRPAAGGY